MVERWNAGRWDHADPSTSHANWRYIDYSSAVLAAGEQWISICRVVFVIVSLIILCKFELRRVAEYGGSTHTRHDHSHRIEDLSYKIIGERSRRRCPRRRRRGWDLGPERKIIVQIDRPPILSYKMSTWSLPISSFFSPLQQHYNERNVSDRKARSAR